MILIGGLNGGGKTTLMDAIRLASYGQRAQIDRRKKSQSYGDFLSQSVSTRAEDNATASVELTFQHVLRFGTIDKLAEIRVQRSWSRNPKGGKDQLQVFLDGWQDEILTKTWDERVEDWLPLGLSNLFLFDGEQIKELAEQDTPPASVIEAIRAVLGLELSDRLAADLEILVNRKRRELAENRDRQVLDSIEQRLNQQRADLETEQERLETLTEKLQTAEVNFQAAQAKFDAEGGNLAEAAPQLQQQLQRLRNEADHHRQNLRHLAADLLPLALIQPLLKGTYQQGQTELHRQQAQAAQDLIADHDRRLLSLIEQLKLKSTQIKPIQAFLEQENQALAAAITGESWLHIDAKTLQQLAQVLQELPNQVKLTQTQLATLKTLDLEISAISAQLEATPSPEDYEHLRSQLETAQLHREDGLFSQELSRRRCTELSQSIEATKAELQRYSEQHIEQHNTDHFLKVAPKVQKTLTAFREKLTLRKLDELESSVTQFFRLLLHKETLLHRVVIRATDFSLTLYDTQGQPVSKHRLSAGEKQLLAIAFLWGLASISKRQLPIAIDTPLSRLDSSHRQNLLEEYFPNASHQMILLSTDTEIGKAEVNQLREKSAIAREYLLEFNSTTQQTQIKLGYFDFEVRSPKS
ncbi:MULTISPECIES: DNA sulfur modification protein DndD [Leptolyngbya]|uniref:DNA sulfur modification protein DndD n=1 Tax=Leptolyngbya TaxID=47251 RepID=UPI001687F9B5|nr:DNA sulfur modification protein DndD [Leptolyngbya sp. FACHB-1624]